METRKWPLTPRQKEILKIIKNLYEANGVGPTHREIAVRANITQPSVAMMINRLILRGYLERDPFVPRTLKPVSSEGGKAA